MLMRYWGRKPLRLIDKIMSDIDGTVIDPFGGTGTIVLSALRHGNKGVYLDINPYAWLVAFVNIISVDAEEFMRRGEEVLENLTEVRKRTLRNDYLYYPNGKPFWMGVMQLLGEKVALAKAICWRRNDDPHFVNKFATVDKYYHTTYPLLLFYKYASEEELEKIIELQKEYIAEIFKLK